MEINSNKLKLIGVVELPEPLEEGKNYHVVVEGECRGSGVDTNDDGTFDRTFKIGIIRLETSDELGKTIKAKDKRKRSQQLRAVIYRDFLDGHIEEDSEEYYDKQMRKIIANYSAIKEML